MIWMIILVTNQLRLMQIILKEIFLAKGYKGNFADKSNPSAHNGASI